MLPKEDVDEWEVEIDENGFDDLKRPVGVPWEVAADESAELPENIDVQSDRDGYDRQKSYKMGGAGGHGLLVRAPNPICNNGSSRDVGLPSCTCRKVLLGMEMY